MELPVNFLGGLMWSTSWGLLSFHRGGVAIIDPVARTIRQEWFVMPGNAAGADWVEGTTLLLWTSGNELGVIDFASTPMTMVNRVSFGATRTAGGLVNVGVDRLLVSGLTAFDRTVELTVPGLAPTGYGFIGGGGVGVSPDGRWIGSATLGPPAQLHFLPYGEVTPVRTLEYLGSHVSDGAPETLRWIPTGVFEWQSIMRSPSGAVAITCELETGTFFRLDLRSRPYQLVPLGALYDHQFCFSGELSPDGSTLLISTAQAAHVEEVRFDPLRIDGLRYGRTNGAMATGEGWLAGYGHAGLALFPLVAGTPRAVPVSAVGGAVGAVLINITVVAPTENTYVKVWSARQSAPFVSNDSSP